MGAALAMIATGSAISGGAAVGGGISGYRLAPRLVQAAAERSPFAGQFVQDRIWVMPVARITCASVGFFGGGHVGYRIGIPVAELIWKDY